jgi:glucose 1-dehydrogenase
MRGLEGKTALVTGGSSGIGQAIAIRLGQEGMNVAVNYVGRPEGAEATKDAIERGVEVCMKEVEAAGGRALLVEADVSKEDEVEAMFDQVASELGGPDFLVNNAGIQISDDSHALDAAAFDRVLAVNLRGSFLCAQRAIRQLLADERPGAIVNVSSVNCKVHDLDNVYLVDSSFFVSSSAVNPTLTIIANALRVADHLKARLG